MMLEELNLLIDNFCLVEQAYLDRDAMIRHLTFVFQDFLALEEVVDIEDEEHMDEILTENEYFVEEVGEIVSGLSEDTIEIYQKHKLWQLADWDIRLKSALSKMLYKLYKAE